VSPKGKEFPAESYLEAIEAFRECMKMLIFFIESWAEIKDSPKQSPEDEGS
jgi:hypothetical protein